MPVQNNNHSEARSRNTEVISDRTNMCITFGRDQRWAAQPTKCIAFLLQKIKATETYLVDARHQGIDVGVRNKRHTNGRHLAQRRGQLVPVQAGVRLSNHQLRRNRPCKFISNTRT
jgi:hypothetical protein